ncbi:MAG TPA: RNA polymerase sigma factor [Polyangiaceae bacterium]|nr:RNA polymerase sigma factor [Polyangiaceae bacterium]
MSTVTDTPVETLEDLMQRFAQGDDSAFETLYQRVSPGLLGKLSKSANDPERARDVVQNTFLKLFRARERYVPGAPVLPWISVIAKRALIDEVRPQNIKREVLSQDGQLPESSDAFTPTAEESLQLAEALGQIPAQYRDAIELTKLEGLSGQEAARELHTTAAAIKQRVRRGYEQLRELLTGSVEPLPAF